MSNGSATGFEILCLETILACNTKPGSVLETDSPEKLLSNTNSTFYEIVNQSKDAKKLMRMALGQTEVIEDNGTSF